MYRLEQSRERYSVDLILLWMHGWGPSVPHYGTAANRWLSFRNLLNKQLPGVCGGWKQEISVKQGGHSLLYGNLQQPSLDWFWQTSFVPGITTQQDISVQLSCNETVHHHTRIKRRPLMSSTVKRFYQGSSCEHMGRGLSTFNTILWEVEGLKVSAEAAWELNGKLINHIF